MQKHINQFRIKKTIAEAMMIFGASLLLFGLIAWRYNLSQFIVVSAVTVALIFMLLGFSNFSSLKDNFKADFINDLLKSHVINSTYDPHHGMTEKQAYDSHLLPQEKSFRAFDLTAGAIKNIAFLSSDIKIKEAHQHLFFGRLFMFEFNRPFQGVTIIQPEQQIPFKRALPRRKALEKHLPKCYQIHASNKQTALQLLNAPFLSAIKALDQVHQQRVSIALTTSKVYISIQDLKNTFEMRLFKPLHHKDLSLYAKDMALIEQLIISIRNNKKIFKTE